LIKEDKFVLVHQVRDKMKGGGIVSRE